MKVWQIILAVVVGLILLIVALLIFGKARIRIIYRKKVKVVLSVLGIRFTLISDKDKTDRPQKDLSRCYSPDRVLKKELRRRRRAAKKAFKKRLKAAKNSAKKAKEKQVQAALQPTPNLKENIEMITELLRRLYDEAQDRVTVNIRSLHLYVGSEDAAKTAIMYGVILQSVSYLIKWIDDHFARVRRDPKNTEIRPDYTSGKCHADVDIVCSVYLSHALGVALKMLAAYRDEKAKALQKAKRRKQAAAAKAQRKTV